MLFKFAFGWRNRMRAKYQLKIRHSKLLRQRVKRHEVHSLCKLSRRGPRGSRPPNIFDALLIPKTVISTHLDHINVTIMTTG